jgi:hypothetical protein
MNRTPANAMIRASLSWALRERSREVLDGLFLVVVGQQDCVFLSLQIPDLGLEVEAGIDRGDVRRRRSRRK